MVDFSFFAPVVIFFYRMPSFLRVLAFRRLSSLWTYANFVVVLSLLTIENRQRRMTSIFRFILNILLPGAVFLEYIKHLFRNWNSNTSIELFFCAFFFQEYSGQSLNSHTRCHLKFTSNK